LWSASVPIAGTLACTYLARERGLDIAALPDLRHVVRWHEGFNAIISLMTDPISGEPHGIHRTYLNFDGTKRDRKMLGRVGVIRVVDGHQRWLGVSEGLEDALSVIQLGWTQRIWAATSAGAIERLPIMDGIERLAIFADADQEGKRAAHRLEDRYRFRRGAHVAIHLPPAPHKDWNDMLRARRRAAV
jgi:hypothetical protein